MAFRAASGDLSGSQSGTRPRPRIHSHAIGTQGPLGGQVISIEASFVSRLERGPVVHLLEESQPSVDV